MFFIYLLIFFRCKSNHNNQQPDELQGFITLKEFMLSRKDDEYIHTINNNNDNTARCTPMNNDHAHVQNQNVITDSSVHCIVQNNGMIYGSPKNGDDVLPQSAVPTNLSYIETCFSSHNFDSEGRSTLSGRNKSMKTESHKKSSKFYNLQIKKSTNNYCEKHQPCLQILDNNMHDHISAGNDNQIRFSTLDYGERLKPQPWPRDTASNNSDKDMQYTLQRILKNDSKIFFFNKLLIVHSIINQLYFS
jgi:hypothetical protein